MKKPNPRLEHEKTASRNRETLPAVLARRLADRGNADVLVIVRADTNAPYSSVRQVLDDARRAGARRLAIATRQKTEPRR